MQYPHLNVWLSQVREFTGKRISQVLERKFFNIKSK